MKFEIDKQTLNDLEIFDSVKNGKSIFTLFDHTQCLGGKKKLYALLSSPSTDIDEITTRKETISFFQKHLLPIGLDIDKDSLSFTEYYFKHSGASPRQRSKFAAKGLKIADLISHNPQYFIMEEGVRSVVGMLKNIYEISNKLSEYIAKSEFCPNLLRENCRKVNEVFSLPAYDEILKIKKIKAYDTARLDYLFRLKERNHIKFFLELIYAYDAYFSAAKTANVYGLSYAEVTSDENKCFDIEGLFHPFVDKAVSCDVKFEEGSNLLFITGPNMAGKSTFLKAVGLSVFLAHAGLPVPTKNMKISVLSGLCTTINISDNLASGYSHFYAEVMRVKDAVNKLGDNNNMLVIFDELFRGTNVKDAYDGTLAVVSALSNIHGSYFIISTHIVEVAKELESNKLIEFCYFEVDEQSGRPVYTYKLRYGVSDVRLGMYIINNEKLIEQINNIAVQNTASKENKDKN